MSTELIAFIWAGIIAFGVLAYVLLDGFDLGVGILFATERGAEDRDVMVNSIAPVWDGNETWLVLGGGGLFAVFPLAYAIIMPALYPVIIMMLLALIFPRRRVRVPVPCANAGWPENCGISRSSPGRRRRRCARAWRWGRCCRG